MLSLTDILICDLFIFRNKHIFCHLKLKIALAIPDTNEKKIESHNSVAERL